MKRYPSFFAAVVMSLYFTLPSFVFAATGIESFNISPVSGSSGYPYSITWTMQDAGGSSLVFPCMDGIKVKNASSDAEIACGISQSSTAVSSDGLLTKIINISGVPKTVSIKLIPKDTSGAEQSSLSQTKSVTVSPAGQVIEYFKTSTSTVEKGMAVSLSWNIPDAAGANISMNCSDTIRATSPEYSSGNLPCGKQIFAAALAKAGSITINFSNSSINSVPVSFTLFPAIGTNIYNGINTELLTLNVSSDIVPDPAVNYFKTSSPLSIFSGDTAVISWSTLNTKGINLKLSCVDGMTATSSAEPYIEMQCDKYAFTDILPSSGSVSILFKNKNNVSKNVTVTLYPAFADKDGYDATKSKSLMFEVKPVGNISPTPTPTPVPSATVKPSPTPTIALTVTPTTKPTPTPTPTPRPASKSKVSPSPTAIKETAPEPNEISDATTTYEIIEETEPEKRIGAAEFKNETEIAGYVIAKKLLDEVREISLSSAENIYEVNGLRGAKLFYLIPVKVKVSLKVDAKTGEVKDTYFAWWSFLVRW